MRTTADGLTRQLRNAGYHIHTFSVSSTGDYAVADADWNYKDVPHLNVVHTKVRCAVGTMDDELITTLAMQKVFGIELPHRHRQLRVFRYVLQTYYTTMGPFALVVYTEYFQLAPNKTKVVTTYNIAGSKLFKLLFPLLQRVLTGNYRTLMSEDLPDAGSARGELRARGFGYRTGRKTADLSGYRRREHRTVVVPEPSVDDYGSGQDGRSRRRWRTGSGRRRRRPRLVSRSSRSRRTLLIAAGVRSRRRKSRLRVAEERAPELPVARQTYRAAR